MTIACFVGSTRVGSVGASNRGLAYGDGVFETMRIHHGELPLWPHHLARLLGGADRLGLCVPDVEFLRTQCKTMIANIEAGVLKLLLTRGDGGRGYAPPPEPLPVWVLAVHSLPPVQTTGVRLHRCETQLAIQPRLAGIKHCNRLEQVLARVEVQRAACDDGVLCDTEGRVVSATSANLLVQCDGHWITPPVTRCGVAGVVRGWLLEHRLVQENELTISQVEHADALALCNAVRGILPVSHLGTRTWAITPDGNDLQAALAMAFPMFSNPTRPA